MDICEFFYDFIKINNIKIYNSFNLYNCIIFENILYCYRLIVRDLFCYKRVMGVEFNFFKIFMFCFFVYCELVFWLDKNKNGWFLFIECVWFVCVKYIYSGSSMMGVFLCLGYYL